MKIKYLKIEGFKSLRQFELASVPDFAVFVGPNGVGKSSIFQAIGLLKDWVGSYSNSKSHGRSLVNVACNEATVVAKFELSESEFSAVARENLIDDNAGLLEAQITITRDATPEPTAHPALSYLFSQYDLYARSGVIEHFSPRRPSSLGSFGSFEARFDLEDYFQKQKGPSVYQGSDFRELPRMMTYLAMDDLVHFRETLEARDSLADLKEIFERFFSPKKFAGYSIERGLGLRFDVETRDGLHHLGGLSEGEAQLFQMLAAFRLLPPKDSAFLFDSPEEHLHGSSARAFAQELYSLTTGGLDNQILVATHSYEFIDESPLESLYRVVVYDERNQAVKVSDERDKLETYEELGASVAIQLTFSKVAFVEGPSDESYIRRMLPDLPITVKLVPSANATNVEQAAAHSAALFEGTSFGQFYAIRDRDYMTNDQRTSLTSKHPRLIILDRYHIENYLLEPSAILSALQSLGIETYSAPEEIEKELESIARDLIDRVVADSVRYQLDRELRGVILKSAGTDPAGLLRSTSAQALEAVKLLLSDDVIASRLETTKQFISENWSRELWMFEFPGREILKRFVGSHAGGQNAREFANLVATEIGRSKGSGDSALRAALNPLLHT